MNFLKLIYHLIIYAVIFFALSESFRSFFHILILSWITYKLYRRDRRRSYTVIFLLLTILILVVALIYEGKQVTDLFWKINLIDINSVALISSLKSPSEDKTVGGGLNEELLKVLIAAMWDFLTSDESIQIEQDAVHIIPSNSSPAKTEIRSQSKFVDEWRSDEEYDESSISRRLSPLHRSAMVQKAINDARKEYLFRANEIKDRKNENNEKGKHKAKTEIRSQSKFVDEWRSDEEYDESSVSRRLSSSHRSAKVQKVRAEQTCDNIKEKGKNKAK